jgi:hypothetical protein
MFSSTGPTRAGCRPIHAGVVVNQSELAPQSIPFASIVGCLGALDRGLGVIPLLRPELLATGPAKGIVLPVRARDRGRRPPSPPSAIAVDPTDGARQRSLRNSLRVKRKSVWCF